MIVYALCGNSYSKYLAKLYFSNRTLFTHSSNVKNVHEKIIRYFSFAIVVVIRYTICLLPNIKLSLALPHLANNYKKILSIIRPHEVYLIDDGITFEYWSDFHEKNIKSILSLPELFGIIGPRLPNWPNKCKDGLYAIVNRANIVSAMRNDVLICKKKPTLSGDVLKAVCVLDDGALSSIEINKLAENFKDFCEVDACHILFHPSRLGVVRAMPAEVFVLDQFNNIKAIYGKASTALFNVIACTRDIKVYSQAVIESDLMESIKESGMHVVCWSMEDGFQ